MGKQQSNSSDDDDPNGWFDASPELINDEGKVQRTSRDVDTQCELLIDDEEPSLTATDSVSFDRPVEPKAISPSFLDQETQTEVDEGNSSPLETINEKISEFLRQHRDLFPRANDESLDEILSVIVKLQDEAKEWQR